jgi:hypothetical protein
MSSIIENSSVNCAGYKIEILEQIVRAGSGSAAPDNTSVSGKSTTAQQATNEVPIRNKSQALPPAMSGNTGRPKSDDSKADSAPSSVTQTAQMPSLDPLLDKVMRAHQKDAFNFILKRLAGQGPGKLLVFFCCFDGT